MPYSEKIKKYYNNSSYIGSLDKNDKNVGSGLVGSPACGDVLKLQFKVGENEIIKDVKFKTFGCGSAIASSSFACKNLIGKTLNQALEIKDEEIAEYLQLPKGKFHCSVLASACIKEAVKNYREKQDGENICKITASAVRKIKEILEKKKEARGLRLGVKNSGCAGLSYFLEFVTKEDVDDILIEKEKIKIYIEKNSIKALKGIEINYNDNDLLNPGFKFVNPNEVRSCGCGISFGI